MNFSSIPKFSRFRWLLMPVTFFAGTIVTMVLPFAWLTNESSDGLAVADWKISNVRLAEIPKPRDSKWQRVSGPGEKFVVYLPPLMKRHKCWGAECITDEVDVRRESFDGKDISCGWSISYRNFASGENPPDCPYHDVFKKLSVEQSDRLEYRESQTVIDGKLVSLASIHQKIPSPKTWIWFCLRIGIRQEHLWVWASYENPDNELLARDIFNSIIISHK